MIEYDPHDWSKHLFDVRGSMVREISYRVLLVVLVAVAVVAFNGRVLPLRMSDRPHALIGVGLGLLLVFRTNAAYDRFWEGRKLWGGVVNASRNLMRGALAHLPPHEAELGRELVEWAVALPWSTMHLLRGKRFLGPVCNLSPQVAEEAIAAEHVPLHVASRITALLRRMRLAGHIDEPVLVSIDASVGALIDMVGACERIHRTPLPFAYVVHLRRALILYCCTLPLVLIEPFGSWSILVSGCMAYIILGIEEIGVEIEDPFGSDENDLPLEGICGRIEGNLRALHARWAEGRGGAPAEGG